MSFTMKDLIQSNPISNIGTLKLLPNSKMKTQKLIIADDYGFVSCNEAVRSEVTEIYKFNPFGEFSPITSVAIGGSEATNPDKIYVCQKQHIVGSTSKGKEFLRITSAHAESFRLIVANTKYIWCSSDFIFNQYTDIGEDKGSYLCPDKINCFLVHARSKHDVALLGCQDSCIRVLNENNLCMEIPLLAPATALVTLNNINLSTVDETIILFVGLEDGTLCQFAINLGSKEFKCHRAYPDVKPYGKTATDSAVNVLCDCSFLNNGKIEIAVGRRDGRLEMWALDGIAKDEEEVKESGDDFVGQSHTTFTDNLGECIMSIDRGAVTNVGVNELIVALFSGRVVSYTPTIPSPEPADLTQVGGTVTSTARLAALRKEVESLCTQLSKQKALLQKYSSPSAQASAIGSTGKSQQLSVLHPPIELILNSRWALNRQSSVYSLSVELQHPLDLLVIRSVGQLEVVKELSDFADTLLSTNPAYLDKAGDGKNCIVISRRHDVSEDKIAYVDGNSVASKRLTIALRVNEGAQNVHTGDVIVTVVADTAPISSKTFAVKIAPLCLQCRQRPDAVTHADLARPRNALKLVGKFSQSMAHDWIRSLLADAPLQLQAIGETVAAADLVRLLYTHCVTGAITICEFKNNMISIESENVSTVAIAKEVLNGLAAFRRIQLQETLNLHPETLPSFLNLIWDRFSAACTLTRQHSILEGLVEITECHGDVSESFPAWLMPEYQDILSNRIQIREQYECNGREELTLFTGIVFSLATDWVRLHGRDGILSEFENALSQLLANKNISKEEICLFISSRKW